MLLLVGLPHTPCDRREGRAGARLAALAFDGGDQGGFFTADKRAGAHAHFQVEGEVGAEDILAQQAKLAGLLDGDIERLDRQRIFRAAVDVALACADRVGGDDHAFDHGMRIAFQHAAVHERARVAFIGVADHVFDIAGIARGKAATSCRPGSLRRRARADRTPAPSR